MKTPLTVIVLTRDEEVLIERCLAGAAAVADEILVVDAGSQDRTRELAIAAGARVIEQPWLGWSGQRNVGAEQATHDWVLFFEADEVPGHRLVSSIQRALSGPMDPRDAYTLTRRDEFLGALMPSEARRRKRKTFVRLYNRTRSRYDVQQLVHEEVVFPGRPIYLEGHLVHWRAQRFHELVETSNRYADVEADELHTSGAVATGRTIVARTVLRFLWCYVLRGGIAHGPRGLMWSMMRASSEFMRWSKLWERQHRAGGTIDIPDRVL